MTQRIVSGMRPTGPLHLGHYFGVLTNWLKLQQDYQCYFFVADWHALTTGFDEPRVVKGFVPELVMDWLAVGLDPAKCVMFQQSQVKEHAELTLLLSMMTPLGWLERNPTWKEVREQLNAKDINTYGFLGYPVLMATDIIMYKPQRVPVGQDQLPHLELTREIVRRFTHLYGECFPEPEAMLTEAPKLPGLDGRKMSKSYGNAISIKESPAEAKKKVMAMLTDTKRMRLKDPGNPDDCNLFPWLVLFEQEEYLAEVTQGCTTATRGCGDCKKRLAQALVEFLEPVQARRAVYEKDPAMVWDVLRHGSNTAREEAQKTMAEVRRLLNFDF